MDLRRAAVDRHRTVRTVLVGLAPIVVGAYLLAWAWRWPWGDLRTVDASAVGGVLMLGGAVALLAGRRISGRRAWVMGGLCLILVVIGLFVLEVVSEGQQEVCGDARPGCHRLLPGI